MVQTYSSSRFSTGVGLAGAKDPPEGVEISENSLPIFCRVEGTMSTILDSCPSRRRWVPTAKCDPRPSGVRQALMPLLLLTQSFVD